jgi:phosphatidyl-myo-inositol dimannoside synthase
MADALMVSSSFLPGRGGIESFLSELCATLSPRLAVLAPATRDGRPIPKDLAYPATGYVGSMLTPTRRVAEAIVASARTHDTDRVLFGTPWPLALLGPRLKQYGLRYAVIVHGAEVLVPAALPGLSSLVAQALAGADLLLSVSRFTESRVVGLLRRHDLASPDVDLLRARVDVERFHPAAHTSSIRRRYGIDDSAPIVLTFGRLVRRKGVHRLIDAMEEIHRRVPEAILVVGGTGPQEKHLRLQAGEARVPVVFTGRVPDEAAPALYSAASVFVLPVTDRWFGLEFEGLGVVLLEAAACGTPCVTGRSGGTPEAVIDGTTGFVVDARDPVALSERVSFLLKEPELATQMGRAGRRHVEEEFTQRGLPESLLGWLKGSGK